MAATDKNYRDLNTLDIVFAVSSILMLVSVIMMFAQDYNREFKKEQRLFRDVEAAVSQRLAVEDLPDDVEFVKAKAQVEEAREIRREKLPELEKLKEEIAALMPDREISGQKYQFIKADLESIMSFYNIAVENPDQQSAAQQYKEKIKELEDRLAKAKAEKDALEQKIQDKRQGIEQIEKPLTDALSAFKRVNEKMDTQVTAAVKKEWSVYDAIRSLPIIDGFASPYKIKQYTLDNVPVDYNFKQTTRFDRCTTCHQGIDRPAYTKDVLASLTKVTDRQRTRLNFAQEALRERRKALQGLPELRNVPSPDQLELDVLPKDYMTESRINEYCAHPRLDLYVGPNSKHPAETFGCSSCHSGQGSATSFSLASHTPTDTETEKRWQKEHGWSSSHYWDYPMLPQRFIESSCLKCHHDVTGTIGRDSRAEAPKLLRGYNLIKEVGCFGCHEIQGRLKGKEVGPDLRLEHSPPLDELPASEREKIVSDPETAPGNLRKVGPSLFRLSEKTNRDWAVKWLKSPREFRPTTKMPHFYLVSNNHPDVLPQDQKQFPDAEIASIAHYLFGASDDYLAKVRTQHEEDKANPGQADKDDARYAQLSGRPLLSAQEKAEADSIRARMSLRKALVLEDLSPDYAGDAKQGRLLFSERGCLACHSHNATTTPQDKGEKTYAPAIASDADFGPDLSQLKAKLGSKSGDAKSARTWLIQWLMDPHVHSPRSRMPVTHLTTEQAADVAAWLLSQEPSDLGPEWNTGKMEVEEPELKTLSAMTSVYFKPLLSVTNFERLKDNKLPKEIAESLPQDERELALKQDYSVENLKLYVGKKAVGRLGCFGCHDVPGFENAKSIGTGLNDWGKKAADRLAFEDIINYVKEKYHVAPSLTDEEGKPVGVVEDHGKVKLPYEEFFFDSLAHHGRTGYLHQKLLEPRSYDYQRLRSWPDLARMPQFKFARVKKLADESDAQHQARAWKEEAEAREAVMTFILGLTAEPIPVSTRYQPQGDRLAEIRGREVLDTYNCASCHLIRPGVFDVKADQKVMQELQTLWEIYKDTPAAKMDHIFYHHNAWVSDVPATTQLSARGAQTKLMEHEEHGDLWLAVRLTSSLRFKGTDGQPHDFRAFDMVRFPLSSMVYPPPAALKSEESLRKFLDERGPYGGAFADLLVKYLVAKDEGKTPRSYELDPATQDSANARVASPPLLIREGERVQTEWLYQFLLDPQPIRQVTVLRMPRFNMSKDEARTLANYFAAVDRITNPGAGTKYPYEEIPQQQDFDSPYWRQKNAEYVARLKSQNLLDSRIRQLEPVWKQILEDYKQQHSAAEANLKEINKQLEPMEKELEKAKEKSAAEFKKLEEKLKEPLQRKSAWEEEVKRFKALVDSSAVEEQRETWMQKEAYITDAYRLVANTQLCLTCHQLGGLQPSNKTLTQGPKLQNVHSRLRPEWTRWWVSHPQRFLTYPSVMPVNFPSDEVKYQQWFAGASIEQVTAARDLLMVFPRAAELPANRYWALPAPGLPLTEGEAK